MHSKCQRVASGIVIEDCLHFGNAPDAMTWRILSGMSWLSK
jgi:hypothetical protein